MREFCTSGSVGAPGEQSPGATRQEKLRKLRGAPLPPPIALASPAPPE